MEHPFFPATTTRAEALRWLTIAEKLLSARDLMGSRSFASRARDSDPTLSPADQILAVVDTLLAGDHRIRNNQQDLYAILRITPEQGRDAELIANQYRSLSLLLNPQQNKFPFADQAFALVLHAWSVLSNPSKKLLYDKELGISLPPDPFTNPNPAFHSNFIFVGGSSSTSVTNPPHSQSAVPFPQVQVHSNSPSDPATAGNVRESQNFTSFSSGSNIAFGNWSGSKGFAAFASNLGTAPETTTSAQVDDKHESDERPSDAHDSSRDNIDVEERVEEGEEDIETNEEPERVDLPENAVGSTFWTSCPYCYYMYEYPRVYVDCTLRCMNCKSAFQAVFNPCQPPIMDGEEGHFYCWASFPLGFKMDIWEKNKAAASTWTPFSPMFSCQVPNSSNSKKKGVRKSSAPRVYIDDDDDDFAELSDSSESDIDWMNDKGKKKKKAKHVRGKGAGGTPSGSAKTARIDRSNDVDEQDGVETPNKTFVKSSNKGAILGARKQPSRAAKNFGKLDLNVECSNEAEEPVSKVKERDGPGRGEDDNFEGNGFFEGLDEFLSSLPILNVVGEDKIVKA